MSGGLRKKKILVVEDEPSLLRALVLKLSREGFEVAQAANGMDGLATAMDSRPDLVILDIIMPFMDGLTMLKKLREDNWGKYVPVIILTNVSDTAKVMETVELGLPDDHLHVDTEKIFSGTTTDGIKQYLQARLGSGSYDFMSKSNWKISEVVDRVKETLAH